MFWIWLIFILNLVIATWNAFVVGAAWNESKAVGGYIRAVVIAGWAMSAFGFIMCYGTLVIAGAYHFEFLGERDISFIISLWFVILGPPLVAACIMIMIHSWVVAFREGGFLNYGIAFYNTWATIHDARVIASGFGSALDNIGSYSGGGSGSSFDLPDGEDGIKAVGVIVCVAIALSVIVFGCLTTWAIVRYVSKRITAEEHLPSSFEEAQRKFGKTA